MLENSTKMLDVFEEFVSKNKLKNFFKVDHICYKCKSNREYEKLRKYYETRCIFFYQAIISGCRIGIIKTDNQYIELSDYESDEAVYGWHHIEIVLKNITLANFLKKLKSLKIEVVHGGSAHHQTNYFYLEKYKIKITKESILEIIQHDMKYKK